jgi:hypothetical protein
MQMTDRSYTPIHYEGQQYFMCTQAVQDGFKQIRSNFQPASADGESGYRATWEIVDNRLYLIALKVELTDGRVEALAALTPESRDLYFASWFTGTICIPLGNILLRRRYTFCSNTWESELLIEIKKGVVVGTEAGVSPLVAKMLRKKTCLPLFPPSLPGNDICVESAKFHASQAFTQLSRSMKLFRTPLDANGITVEELQHLLLNQDTECAFGFGAASGAETATEHAIDHGGLGLSSLQQASAALVAIEVPPQAQLIRETQIILTTIRSHLPSGAPVCYSIVPTQQMDDSDFRISIFATGIPQSSHIHGS